MSNGFYYLHKEGGLIYKRDPFAPEEDSPFVKKVWKVDSTDRGNAWKICLEALALGASIERIKELAHKWNLTFDDCLEMLKRKEPTELMRKGLPLFAKLLFELDEDAFWKKIKEKWEEK